MNRYQKNETGLYGFEKRLTKTKATAKIVNASELSIAFFLPAIIE